MIFEIEYLGEGHIVVKDVGIIGAMRFDRVKKKQVRVTRVPCSEKVARHLFEDKRFKVHGLTYKKIESKKGDK